MGDLFGIFFEDLNHAADGGLYAELVQNRSFEFDPIDHPDYHALTAWEKVERGGGECEVRVKSELPLNKHGTAATSRSLTSVIRGQWSGRATGFASFTVRFRPPSCFRRAR